MSQWIIWLGVLIAGTVVTLVAIGSRAGTMDPESFFTDQQTAAYRAAQEGAIDRLTDAVSSKSVDLNRPGKDDMTMLGLAVLTADRQAIISLVHAGADPNQVIPEAGSPAILAISRHFDPPRTEAVAALIDAGYDVNQRISGAPYLFFFVNYGHRPGLELALDRGGDVNARSSGGESLLTYVVEGGDYPLARALIERGADVSARGKLGETALRAIEYKVKRTNPSLRKVWSDVLAMRELILSKLPDPEDRRSAFTDEAERKIRDNPPPN